MVSLTQLHSNYTNAPKKQKPATVEWQVFECPYGLQVAPRPGLEPGTYGLTENSRFTKPVFYAACSVIFNYVQQTV
jgi:hypothetical protein